MVPQRFMLLCVYGFEQYCHLNDSCKFCFLFCVVFEFKKEIGKKRSCYCFQLGSGITICLIKCCSFYFAISVVLFDFIGISRCHNVLCTSIIAELKRFLIYLTLTTKMTSPAHGTTV